jgi:hypothetical protein
MNHIIAEKKYIASTLNVPFDSLSQSSVRAEKLLTTHTSIPFDLQKGKVQTPLVTERLIELNDQFVVTHFSIGIKTIGTATPTSVNQLNADIDFYADPTVYSGTNRPNVAAIFNSSLNWTIDRKEFLPNFPMDSFRRVPETQTATNAGYTSSGVTKVNSSTNGLFGFYPCEPIILDGRQTLDLAIDLGDSVTFNDSSISTYAVVRLRGYLVVNAKD